MEIGSRYEEVEFVFSVLCWSFVCVEKHSMFVF
jgi:hypothetical protein